MRWICLLCGIGDDGVVMCDVGVGLKFVYGCGCNVCKVRWCVVCMVGDFVGDLCVCMMVCELVVLIFDVECGCVVWCVGLYVCMLEMCCM